MYVERFSLLETVARMENLFELFGYESIVAGIRVVFDAIIVCCCSCCVYELSLNGTNLMYV